MTKLTGELKVNEPDANGLTPLHFAVVSKKASTVFFVDTVKSVCCAHYSCSAKLC